MPIVRTSISYSKEMQEPLLALAKKDRRSLSGYIQMLIENHLLSKGVDLHDKKKPKKKVRRKKVTK